MPIIAFCSPKGGVGKTTASVIAASELAQRGASVTIVDCDPNRGALDWSRLPGVPASLDVVGDGVTEETITEVLEEVSARSTFVVCDLEGTASLMVAYATGMADLVVIPVQGSQLDAKQAARQMRLIKAQEKMAGRPIPFVVLLNRTSPTIVGRTQRHIEGKFGELALPVLATRLHDREAYRALFSIGGTLAALPEKNVSNLPAAVENARTFVAELTAHLRASLKHQEVA
jgi:chromosome partitioning protein